MLVRFTKDVGSWVIGTERDLQEDVAERLIKAGQAQPIQNKKVMGLADALNLGDESQKRLEAEASISAQEKVIPRNKSKRGE